MGDECSLFFFWCCILFLGSASGCWLVDGHGDECGLCGVCSLAFFFFWAIALRMCMTQPLSRCGVVCNPCVLDRFFVIFWVRVPPLIHCCPGSVRVTGYI